MSYYVHSLDPFAIQFTQDFGIRWYGLAYLVSFLISYFMVSYMAKIKSIPLSVEKVGDFITYMAIGTLAGGRLGYCLFYSPDLLTQFSGEFPFWGVLEVHRGGMASHGGILGFVAVVLWYGRKEAVPWRMLGDLTALGASLGAGIGRIANFINGELFGRAAGAGVKWAVQFPQEVYLWANYQTEKLKTLVEAVSALGPVSLPNGKTQVVQAETWLEWVSRYKFDSSSHQAVNALIEQMILAVQKGQESVILALGEVLTPRHPSQLYQSVLEGFLVFFVISMLWLKPRKPGVISGVAAIMYALARILGEHFRMPDAHIGFQALGLTRGQWLSVVMIVIFILYIFFSLKAESKPMGGWRKNKG